MRTQGGRVGQWLARLDPEWRHWSGKQLLEFGDCVVYPQIRLEGFTRVEGILKDLASMAKRLRDQPPSPDNSIFNESRLLDLGMLFHLASVIGASQTPRSQAYFPAVLLERMVLQPLAGNGDLPQKLIHHLLPPRLRSALLASVSDSSLFGFGKRVRWPTPEEAGRMHRVVRSCKAEWERLVELLLDHTEAGRLVFEDSARSDDPEVRLLIDELNDSGQRESIRLRLDRTRHTMVRAEGILANLARPEGWFALHTAWIVRVLEYLHKRVATGCPAGELAVRELLLPMSLLQESFSGRPFNIYEEAPPLPDARRQRLRRERAQCSQEPLPILESDDFDLIRDLSELRLRPATARLAQ